VVVREKKEIQKQEKELQTDERGDGKRETKNYNVLMVHGSILHPTVQIIFSLWKT
jgi:hypothetical protein